MASLLLMLRKRAPCVLPRHSGYVRFVSTDQIPLVHDVFRPRLEEHYYNSLMEDLMVLSYDHFSPSAGLDTLESFPEWNRSLGDYPLHDLYSSTLAKLPTRPESQQMVSSLLALETAKQELRPRRYRKLLYNPIDYTAVPRHILTAKPPPPPPPPYAPLPSRLPIPKRIELKIWCEQAATNKNLLLSAIMCLQSISGTQASPLFAETGDSSKRIRAGMPLGARVELTGSLMYGFIDKLTQCVLPRMREFKGISPIGNDQGMMKLVLPETAVGYFPDIEPHFDQYPRMFETDVMMYTTGKNDWEAALCLSGFQIPFMEEKHVVVESVAAETTVDRWTAIRAAKTKEERARLHKIAEEEEKKSKQKNKE
ncbi:hypothetical protein BDV3_003139 [Batrachochytrium dendrobatidis]